MVSCIVRIFSQTRTVFGPHWSLPGLSCALLAPFLGFSGLFPRPLGPWIVCPWAFVPGARKNQYSISKNDTAAKQKTMIAAEKTDDSSNYQTHRGNMVLTGPWPSLFWASSGLLPFPPPWHSPPGPSSRLSLGLPAPLGLSP